MPGTRVLEQNMTDYVYKNLLAMFKIYRQENTSWLPVAANADLNEGTVYRMDVYVQNIGSETYVKNVQIRVTNPYPARITYYKSSTCRQSDKVDRLDSPIYPKILNPRTNGTQGEKTPVHSVYLKVKEGPDEPLAAIAGYGIYAEIVPQGHAWDTYRRALD